ncbi:uncharacterized protein LTR77_001741 [Saxophila tyrrhenica]|uniref:Maltose/galactoside acetyltransferase domain-containing protein n=1 Tax=Saxophila tyrrhenica TaxID=1690608 RepID=A0AAV9PMD4_9PEZI|nr:hypothetical protein LTR77_001741 [Saxophila tyrrhenica]
MATSENKQRQLRGDLYFAFTPEMVEGRRRCTLACQAFNNYSGVSRRERVRLWREIVGDTTPLPSPKATEIEDEALFSNEPWVEPPIRIDYGTNLVLGEGVFINFNATILDTCKVTIGARTLLASGGTAGPELGKEITIEEDCWLGGNVTVLPGITIGKGSTVGAASVVTKDVAPYTVVAGNPARFIRDVPRGTKEEFTSGAVEALARDEGNAWDYDPDEQHEPADV